MQLLHNIGLALRNPLVFVICFYMILAGLGKTMNYVERHALRKLQEKFDAEDMLEKLER